MNANLSPDETVARILGLPMDRIEYLKCEHEMPVEEPAFSEWFVLNANIILLELRTQFEASLFPVRELRPEPAETTA